MTRAVSAMEAFEKLEKVGEGTYGKVYRARERATGRIVALKKTRLHEDEEGVPPTTLREVSILRMLSRDPHVVRFQFPLSQLSNPRVFFVWVLASLPDFLFLAQFKCFLVLGQKAITKLLLLSRLFGNTGKFW